MKDTNLLMKPMMKDTNLLKVKDKVRITQTIHLGNGNCPKQTTQTCNIPAGTPATIKHASNGLYAVSIEKPLKMTLSGLTEHDIEER